MNEVKITITTANLKKSHIPQFDSIRDSDFHRDNDEMSASFGQIFPKPLCRVDYGQESYVLFQCLNTVKKISVSNYLNCGWEKRLGQIETIQKVIL